jgi:hypothetical protein
VQDLLNEAKNLKKKLGEESDLKQKFINLYNQERKLNKKPQVLAQEPSVSNLQKPATVISRASCQKSSRDPMKLKAAFDLESELEGFKREMQQSNDQSFQMKSKPSGYLHTLM